MKGARLGSMVTIETERGAMGRLLNADSRMGARARETVTSGSPLMLVMLGRDIRTRCPMLRPRVVELEDVGDVGDVGDLDEEGESKVVSDEMDQPRRDGDVVTTMLGVAALSMIAIGATTCSVVALRSLSLRILKQSPPIAIPSSMFSCTTRRARWCLRYEVFD